MSYESNQRQQALREVKIYGAIILILAAIITWAIVGIATSAAHIGEMHQRMEIEHQRVARSLRLD